MQVPSDYLKKALLVPEKPGGESAGVSLHELRKIQQNLDSFLHSFDDPNLAFLAFFLSNFIADVFENLSGDFPYTTSCGEEAYNIREKAFVEVSKGLSSIADGLAAENFNACLTACITLTRAYLKTLEELKGVTEQGQR